MKLAIYQKTAEISLESYKSGVVMPDASVHKLDLLMQSNNCNIFRYLFMHRYSNTLPPPSKKDFLKAKVCKCAVYVSKLILGCGQGWQTFF